MWGRTGFERFEPAECYVFCDCLGAGGTKDTERIRKDPKGMKVVVICGGLDEVGGMHASPCRMLALSHML